MTRNERILLSLVLFQTVLCLLLTVFCAFRLEEIESKNQAQIEQVKIEVEENQEKCERLIDTNLDIFLNHRWE